MWEIYTFGGAPYPTVENNAILAMLKGGYRMPKPDDCPDDIYHIMKACWEYYPEVCFWGVFFLFFKTE